MTQVICIARQFGSGGRAIGKLLAKKLGFKFYDSALVDLAAEKGNLSYENASKFDEKPTNPWDYTQVYPSIHSNTQTETDRMYKLQTEIIKEKAKEDNCIFVGRAADVILEDDPDVNLISVFIYAPFEWRVKRLIRTEGFGSERETISAMKKKDKQRKNYYDYYTGREYTDPENYDICVNSAFLGIEKSAEFLKSYLEFVNRVDEK